MAMARPEITGRGALADDLLEGVGKIARFTGLKPRRVFYLAEGGRLPLFKIGNRWCARKSTLIEHIAKLERGEAEHKVA
jgi:hypothetical protein